MKIRAVLFDLDGTLLDSLGDLADSVNAVRANLGLLPLQDSEVAGGIGEGLGVLLRHCLPEEHQADLTESRRRFLAHYQEHFLVRSRPYPGVEDILVRIDCPVGLVTNKPRRFAEPLLEELGWHFDVTVFGDDDAGRKPAANPLLKALTILGVPPEASVYVGDHRVDFLAAQAAGMMFWAVPWASGLEPYRLAELGDIVRFTGRDSKC